MLYYNEFEDLWNNVLKKMIIFYSKEFGIKYKPMFLIKFRLRYYYEKYKDIVVKNYMVWNTINIDRHKIAACTLKAILATKPLYIPLTDRLKFIFSKLTYEEILNHKIERKYENESLKKYFIFFNEYLAINVATAILDSYINSNEEPNRFKHNIVVPEPFPTLDFDYLRDMCIGLYYSDLKSINPITYANIFFLWEKYSCRKKRCDNLADAYKKLLKEKENILTDEDLDLEVEKAMLS